MRFETAGRVRLLSSYTVRAVEIGGWAAEAAIVADDIAPGPCVIGGWRGTIREVRQAGPVAHLDIRAGDDALDAATTARHWAATLPASTVAAALAQEGGTTATAPGQLATWRAHGGTLRDETARLARWLSAGAWRVDEITGGIIIGEREGGAADAPGTLTDAGAVWRAYSLDPSTEALPDVVGRTVDGHRIERAVFEWTGKGPPAADLFAPGPASSRAPGTVQGGTVEADTEDRATVRLDDGTVLGDVPLWFIPGVRVAVASGTRVLVIDLGGDPRSPVAFAAPFDSAPSSDLGIALRIGDIVMMPFGSAGTPTPTPLEFAPGVGADYGPPGSGKSRVRL